MRRSCEIAAAARRHSPRKGHATRPLTRTEHAEPRWQMPAMSAGAANGKTVRDETIAADVVRSVYGRRRTCQVQPLRLLTGYPLKYHGILITVMR